MQARGVEVNAAVNPRPHPSRLLPIGTRWTMRREAIARGQGTCHGEMLLPFVMDAIEDSRPSCPCRAKGLADRRGWRLPRSEAGATG